MIGPFFLEPFEPWKKDIAISGPGIELLVDYDDVDHEEVEKNANKVVEILNQHWN